MPVTVQTYVWLPDGGSLTPGQQITDAQAAKWGIDSDGRRTPGGDGAPAQPPAPQDGGDGDGAGSDG